MAAFVAEQVDLIESLLLVEFADGNLDRQELLLLLLAVEDDAQRRLLLPIQEIGNRLCLDDLDEETCVSRFRFSMRQLKHLCVVLRFPHKMTSRSRVSWTGLEGTLVLFRRLSYPNKLREMTEEFGRSKAALSLIFNETLLWFTATWGHLLENPFVRPYFTPALVNRYVDAVAAMAKVNLRVWGFIDGTLRRICRPGAEQQVFYNGHKRCHAIKFQAVVTPDGLITHLYGPVEGRRHDAGILADSGLLPSLQQHMRGPGGQAYALYGDSAYPFSPFLQKGYQGAALTPQQAEFNDKFSRVRTAVEWAFGEVTSSWAFLDMKRQQKLLLQPVGLYYKAACLLSNCENIVRQGNKCSKFFKLKPPSLEEYFQ